MDSLQPAKGRPWRRDRSTSKPGLLVSALACGLLACGPTAGEPEARWLDLTHAFDADTIVWPTEEGFVLESEHRGPVAGGYWYETNRLRGPEHGGTHIDAPVHFAEGAHTVDEIPIDRLIGQGVRIDVREASAQDRDYLIGVEDLTRWESAHGRIPDGAIVLFDTGYAAYWPERGLYLGTGERGEGAVADLHFPGIDPEAARWLVEERAVGAVGLDTASIDRGQSTEFMTHRVLGAANVPAFENVGGMDEVPPRGFEVYALPMKIRGGSGGPLRLLVRVPAP